MNLSAFLNTVTVRGLSICACGLAAISAAVFTGAPDHSWQNYVYRASLAVIALGASHGIISNGAGQPAPAANGGLIQIPPKGAIGGGGK